MSDIRDITINEDTLRTWVMGHVFSEIDGHRFNGKIEITHHQPMLFIAAPSKPYDLRLIREAMSEENVNAVSSVPSVDMTLESYVRVSSLPKEMQDSIRKYLKFSQRV